MTGVAVTAEGSHDGLLGLYALAQMDRRGPVHGYLIAEAIADRTEGSWHPGPGAVYPALKKLVRRGLARSHLEGRRRVYSITPRGREVLLRIRARQGAQPPRVPDLSVLWAEVSGVEDAQTFLLLRLRRSLDSIEAMLVAPARSAGQETERERLRAEVARELTSRLDELYRPRVRLAAIRPR